MKLREGWMRCVSEKGKKRPANSSSSSYQRNTPFEKRPASLISTILARCFLRTIWSWLYYIPQRHCLPNCLVHDSLLLYIREFTKSGIKKLYLGTLFLPEVRQNSTPILTMTDAWCHRAAAHALLPATNALQRWNISQGKLTCFEKPKNGEEEVNKR